MAREIEAEEAEQLIDEMFADLLLDDKYKAAWDIYKADHKRVCKDNFNFRMGGKQNETAA